jgi:putative sigma-54 modulation protein
LDLGRSESTTPTSPAPGTPPPPQASVGSKTRSAARVPFTNSADDAAVHRRGHQARAGDGGVIASASTPAAVQRHQPKQLPTQLPTQEAVTLQIAIRHGKVDVSPTLRATVEEKVGRVGRFFEGIERAEVRFVEEANPRIAAREVCEVTMHGHGHVVRARAAATDPYAAVDRVVDKLEHQMTKLKGKLLGRSHPRRTPSVESSDNAAGGEV